MTKEDLSTARSQDDEQHVMTGPRKSQDSNFGLTFEKQIDGWPGAGFKRAVSKISFRRVANNERDELQISFSKLEIKGDKERMFETFGCIAIPARDLPDLLKAITVAYRAKGAA